jgi:hypothetical protein
VTLAAVVGLGFALVVWWWSATPPSAGLDRADEGSAVRIVDRPSRDLPPTRQALPDTGLTVLDRNGQAVVGARLWPVDTPPIVLPAPPSDAAHSDERGRVRPHATWLGRSVLCVAEGFVPAIEPWPEHAERTIVLDRAPSIVVAASIDVRPLPACEVVFARARIGNAGARAVAARWGEGPVVGMAGDEAVWRVTTDAAGQCTVSGLPEGTYYVAAFHGRAYPLDERYLGAVPLYVGAGVLVIECEPFLAAAVRVPTTDRVVATWAIVPRGVPSDRAGGIARRAYAARRMEAELGATMVRLLAPEHRGLAGSIEAEFRVLCADGSLWFGAVPMIDARELEGAAFLEQADDPVASLRIRLRRGAQGSYPGTVNLLHGPARGVPPLPVRDGDVLRLPRGTYRWELSAPNPWLPRTFEGGAFELTGAVDVAEWIIELPDLVPITIRPKLAPSVGPDGDAWLAISIENDDGSANWFWQSGHGDIHNLVPPGLLTVHVTRPGGGIEERQVVARRPEEPLVLEFGPY